MTTLQDFLEAHVSLRKEIVGTLAYGSGMSARWWKVSCGLSERPSSKGKIDMSWIKDIEANAQPQNVTGQADRCITKCMSLGITVEDFIIALRAALLELLANEVEKKLKGFEATRVTVPVPAPTVNTPTPNPAPDSLYLYVWRGISIPDGTKAHAFATAPNLRAAVTHVLDRFRGSPASLDSMRHELETIVPMILPARDGSAWLVEM